MIKMQQNLPDLARTIRDSSGDAVSAWTRQAASAAREHRQEMLILAGTLAFAVFVALVSLPAVL